jgi:chromosome segregation ATPase
MGNNNGDWERCMEFTIGNIITLFIVAIVLAIYRQLDKNNRSLEKIKRYSEKIKDELDFYIESKTVEVKNFAIELDVHQETGKAILNRILKAEENLELKAAYIEKMYERINEYDKALDELTQMTGRVQSNLDRLHEESEFVDKVGKRIKEAGLNILKLEKNIPAIKTEFAKENIKELKLVRSVVLKDTQKVVAHIKSEIVSNEKMINSFTSSVKALDNTKETMKKETVESIRNFLDEQIYKTEQTGEQLTAELADRFDTILVRKSEEARSVEADMQNVYTEISDKFGSASEEMDQQLNQFKSKINTVESIYTESLKAASERGLALEDDVFDSVRQKISNDIEGMKKEAERRVEEINSTVSTQLSGFDVEYKETIDKSRNDLNLLSVELKDSDASIRDRLSSVENRVHEYEDNISYKFTKLEDISNDLDSLEKNLKISMEQTTTNIEAGFQNYARQQDNTQLEYKQKISDEMKELDDGLNTLELELNGLKTRAYENVAKGLKVFEDDFFADLKNKNVVMEEKFLEWRGRVDKNLEEIAALGDDGRRKIEKNYNENLRIKLEDLQERVFSNQSKFENQVLDFQNRIEDRMSQSDTSVETIEESIKKNLVEIQENSNASFSREFVEFRTGISTQLKKSERDIDTKLKNIDQLVDQKGKELFGLLENSQSEVTLWQAKVLQEMKEAETDMTSGYEDLKKDVLSNITQIKGDFESQKEDLIINTQEERARIKNELKENAVEIIQLESDLRSKTESSLESFNREYETFLLEIQKKNRDMHVDFDRKIKEFRLISSETKEKTDQLQKKLYGKVEENYKILAANLQEIDKRQKGFINQTKIFDRADSLKVSLQESIEDLKSELTKVEAQSNAAREAERKFGSIKKLADEVNIKLGRFLTEKRRIEEMEGDFKKLIIISQSVDTKLALVTNSHDDLQEIQIKIKNLEELEKDISVKFERLEKKDQIIENTTASVDKNFSQLSSLDDQIKVLNDDVGKIPEKIHDLSSKIELLSRNKKKADETAKQVEALDGLLEEIEVRVTKMQKAREWLAKTETRFEEVSKQAQEQVKLLGSILKEGNKSKAGSSGAPSMGARDVVTRLAHQGWSVQEIASTTKLSRGEVELILELLPKK